MVAEQRRMYCTELTDTTYMRMLAATPEHAARNKLRRKHIPTAELNTLGYLSHTVSGVPLRPPETGCLGIVSNPTRIRAQLLNLSIERFHCTA
jgi:hypothetical protein